MQAKQLVLGSQALSASAAVVQTFMLLVNRLLL